MSFQTFIFVSLVSFQDTGISFILYFLLWATANNSVSKNALFSLNFGKMLVATFLFIALNPHCASFTPVGRIIDGFSDYIVGISVYIGMGIGFGKGCVK